MLQKDVGALVKHIARYEYKKPKPGTPAVDQGKLSYRSSEQRGSETVCERFVQRDILSYELPLATLHLDQEFVFWHPLATHNSPKSKNSFEADPDDGPAENVDGDCDLRDVIVARPSARREYAEATVTTR